MTVTSRTEVPDDSPWDVVVIGAGPSGAMAARDLAVAGTRVLLVERRDFPREKVCGGCLNGRALAELRIAGLGTLAELSGAMPLRSFRLGVRGCEARLDLPAGMVVTRARFDAALVGAAVAAGAHFLPRTEAGVGAVEGSARLVHLGCSGNARTIRAKVVLAATGLGHSCLPKGAAPRTRIAPGSSIGAGCFLLDGPSEYEAGTIHMAVGKDGYVGLVRLRDGSLHLAAALRPGALRKAGGPGEAASVLLAAAGFPAIDGLASARWQGTPALTRRTRPLADTRVFVVGDAAGYVEPFTGEGIAWALSSGRTIATLAFRAVERWEPRLIGEWEILHHRVVRRRQTLCRAASLVLRRPLLARAACELMSRLPGSTRRIVALLNAPSPSMEAS